MNPLTALVLVALSLLVFYFVVRLAVRDGILAAQDHRQDRSNLEHPADE